MIPRVSDERPAWRKQLEHSLAELETLGKQIGSKLGEAAKDASHEAKEAWQKLEPRIGEVENQVGSKLRETFGPREGHEGESPLERVSSEVTEQIDNMVTELRSSLKALRDKL